MVRVHVFLQRSPFHIIRQFPSFRFSFVLMDLLRGSPMHLKWYFQYFGWEQLWAHVSLKVLKPYLFHIPCAEIYVHLFLNAWIHTDFFRKIQLTLSLKRQERNTHIKPRHSNTIPSTFVSWDWKYTHISLIINMNIDFQP